MHFMVIRKCLVYNLDLFAVQIGKIVQLQETVVVRLLYENSKVEKDLWLQCVSSLFLFTSFSLTPFCPGPTAVCINFKERYKFSRQHQKCTS